MLVDPLMMLEHVAGWRPEAFEIMLQNTALDVSIALLSFWKMSILGFSSKTTFLG